MSLDYAFYLIIINGALVLDIAIITDLPIYCLLCLITNKLLAEELNDTQCFTGDFNRIRHILIFHPGTIDDIFNGPPFFGIFLKHASEQVLQLLAWSDFFGSPVSFEMAIMYEILIGFRSCLLMATR